MTHDADPFLSQVESVSRVHAMLRYAGRQVWVVADPSTPAARNLENTHPGRGDGRHEGCRAVPLDRPARGATFLAVIPFIPRNASQFPSSIDAGCMSQPTIEFQTRLFGSLVRYGR